jgi:sterol desaturase/sphingolipid hydroxylase (fatty acid hydroxylase superfamily)
MHKAGMFFSSYGDKYHLIALVAPLLVFGLEIAIMGWKESSLRKLFFEHDSSQRTDILFFLVSITGILTFLTVIFSLGGIYVIQRIAHIFMNIMANLDLRLDTGNRAENFAVFYFIYSYLEYWSHRIYHTGPFWYLHRLHHSATSLNPLVMHRAHPANLVLDPLLRVALPIGLVAVAYQDLFGLFVVCALQRAICLVGSNPTRPPLLRPEVL